MAQMNIMTSCSWQVHAEFVVPVLLILHSLLSGLVKKPHMAAVGRIWFRMTGYQDDIFTQLGTATLRSGINSVTKNICTCLTLHFYGIQCHAGWRVCTNISERSDFFSSVLFKGIVYYNDYVVLVVNRWVRSICETILTGQNWNTGRKTSPIATLPHMDWPGIEWRPPQWKPCDCNYLTNFLCWV